LASAFIRNVQLLQPRRPKVASVPEMKASIDSLRRHFGGPIAAPPSGPVGIDENKPGARLSLRAGLRQLARIPQTLTSASSSHQAGGALVTPAIADKAF